MHLSPLLWRLPCHGHASTCCSNLAESQFQAHSLGGQAPDEARRATSLQLGALLGTATGVTRPVAHVARVGWYRHAGCVGLLSCW